MLWPFFGFAVQVADRRKCPVQCQGRCCRTMAHTARFPATFCTADECIAALYSSHRSPVCDSLRQIPLPPKTIFRLCGSSFCFVRKQRDNSTSFAAGLRCEVEFHNGTSTAGYVPCFRRAVCVSIPAHTCLHVRQIKSLRRKDSRGPYLPAASHHSNTPNIRVLLYPNRLHPCGCCNTHASINKSTCP